MGMRSHQHKLEKIKDRKDRITNEILVKDMYATIDLDANDISETVEKKVLLIISLLSQRIRELRESIVVKKRAVEQLKLKVGREWKGSKLTPSISYLQSKIIQSTSVVQSLLECVDDFGYIAAS